MTGPLVGVTVLQPADGTVVLPGQSVTCSGRATGHLGVQTTLVDRVVLSLDRGSGIEAVLSLVMPRPAVPAVNWAASVAAPGQPGPHELTITAFPADGGAPASVTVGFTVQAPASSLTGVWECDDGGLYYLRQGPDRSVIWAGLHDSGFHKGLDFTNVFRGWLSADGGALAGDWADVPRGATANSGTLAASVIDDADGFRLVRVDDQTTGGFSGQVWRPTGSPLGAQDIADVAGRVQRYDGPLGENNPPCRDFTVMWGGVWQPTGPPLPPIPYSYSYCAFLRWVRGPGGPTALPWDGDGDFTFNFTPLWSTDFANGTDWDDFWGNGWVPEQPSEFPQNPVELIGSQFQQFQRFHCEAAMYGRENSGPEDCEAAPRNLLPGWNERSGWSVLINGRPVEGRLTVVNPDDEENRFLSFAVGPDGQTVELHPNTFARVTGVIADDAGHGNTNPPEIHPVYAIDMLQNFMAPRPQPVTLSGVWHGSDNGTYYLRQIGHEVWWLGLSRDQGRSFANVFHGTIGPTGAVEGQWTDVPMGAGGASSGGTLMLGGDQADPQLLTTLNKTGETGGFGAATWTKIYDTPGVPASPPPPVSEPPA
jgi:hypothetical protein